MNLIKKILAPTDLSPFSAKGVRYACHLAKVMQAQVTMAHVLDTAEFLAIARSMGVTSGSFEPDSLLEKLLEGHKRMLQQFLEQYISDLKTDLNLEQIVEKGEPHAMLINWAKSKQVDLIVMSTHGRSGLPRMLIGSVTERVLRSSPCPVLAIPSHEA